MINISKLWADSYETKWEEVFKEAQGKGFSPDKATEKAWSEWVNSNSEKIQCIQPLTPPTPTNGTTDATKFKPVKFKGCKTAEQSAQVLANAFQAWATSITWMVPPPAPPFSAVTSVIMDSASVTSAYTTLLSDLIVEFKKVPKNEAAAKAKTKALATAFYKATTSLQVQFIGLDMKSPPTPLQISVPVM